jgi:mycothiol S-conjugate amidase
MADERCLLTVHAHPDDESSKGPATVARYHAEGVRTVLVCCTGGEAGDILNPAMDTDEVKARMPEIRRQELERAASIIGYDEVVLLGYRDSGMPGSEDNSRPESFAMAPLDEAVERLVAVVRRVRPQVMVTYPKDQSEYPHPDHLRAQEIATAAFEAAGAPERFSSAGAPFTPLKLYATTWPASRMLEMHEKFLELGLPSPFDDKWLARLQRRRQETWTTKIDVSGFTDVRQEALRAHATQVDPTSAWWFGLPPEVMRTIHPFDEYRLVESRVGEATEESDLFERVPVGVSPG